MYERLARRGTGCIVVMVGLCIALSGPASGQIFNAPLTNGDYGGGATQDTMAPIHGASPHNLGIVSSAEGTRFTSTDQYNRGNGVIYWAPGADAAAFRQHGTLSLWMNADHDPFAAMTAWGHIFCENFGWSAFHNGQSTFSGSASFVANDPGAADDALRLGWGVWHNSVWYYPTAGQTIDLAFDRWYNVGYTWGGTDYDYEIWVDGELRVGYDLPTGVNLPWGMSSSAAVVALGGAHERGMSTASYSSAVGITYRDLHLWTEVRPRGDTVPEPGTLMLALLGVGLWRRTGRA